ETFNNLNISNTSGAVVTNANLDLSGNLNIIAASGILNVLTNGNNIFLEGNWTNNNGAGGFLEGSQRVTFNGTSNQSINSSTPETFYDLNIDNNGAEVRPTVNLSILNDLDISATGVLNASVSSVDLSIAGNWTNLNGASGFNQGTESVTFSGSGASQISNASGEEFYDLVINKSSNNVTINNEITISSSGSLTLTSGDVVCGANIVLNSSSNIVGGSSSSYVQTNGSAIRKMLNANGTYQFPIGDNSNYSPITFDLNNGSLSSAFVDVSVTNSPHPNRAGATAYLNRYWTINQSGISGSIDYDVSFVYLNGDIVGSESVYFPGKWDGANWISVGSVNTGTNTVSMPGLTTFSDFTAMDNTDSPLPVELADYKVNLIENNDVKVSWSTLAEINNEKFEIYRTVDTLEYEHIGSVSGNANSNQLQDYEYIDRDPHLGQSYYRLVQIDFSGDTTYYELKPIFILDDFEEQNWSIYPNPSNGEFTLKGNKLKPNSEYRVSIFDNLSLLHYQRIFTTDQGGNILVQDPIHHEYAPGVYHMIIENPDGVTEIEIVIN
ncbi:MAG: hypothetical protein MRY83_18045, partial [Flavobacteriales bacterium]|nr:hypothetical protein [Flavobacteriales bacterium]